MYSKIEKEREIDYLVSLAYKIWSAHFGTLFDSETVSKLIEAVQSKEAIINQISNGLLYYFISLNNERIGYFAYKIHPDRNELFLSKLYIEASQRGKGVGRKVLQHLEEVCRKKNIQTINLLVYHKNLGSIKAYEKWGFENLGLIERRFSNDLVFTDVKMRKQISH